jgi:homoaconitase
VSTPLRVPTRTLASITNNVNSGAPIPAYERFQANLQIARRKLDGRPLTLAEKILYAHLSNPESDPAPVRGSSYLKLSPGMCYSLVRE